MAQFIIVTDVHDTKHRLNVDHLASYAEKAKHGGAKMANEFTLEVQETASEIDKLIQNIEAKAFFSDRPDTTVLAAQGIFLPDLPAGNGASRERQ